MNENCILENGNYACSLESLVVAEADEIAQRHHDVEDAIRGELITKDEISKIIINCFKPFLSQDNLKMLKKSNELDEETFIVAISRIIVNLFVTELIRNSIYNINELIVKESLDSQGEIVHFFLSKSFDLKIKNLISYESENSENIDLKFSKKAKKFEKIISSKVLSSFDIQKADAKGKYIIRKIFQAYFSTPEQLPNHCVIEFLFEYDSSKYSKDKILGIIKAKGIGQIREKFLQTLSSKDDITKLKLMRVICDHIAGMTDSYAYKTYKELYS